MESTLWTRPAQPSCAAGVRRVIGVVAGLAAATGTLVQRVFAG